MIPSPTEALQLAELLAGVALLVCIFMLVNNAAHAASDAINTRRNK